MKLLYKRLNREHPEFSPVVREAEVSQEALHVRKLVDATLFDDGLFEHTSNAFEGVEVVYGLAPPNRPNLIPPHRPNAYGCALEYYDVSGGTPRLLAIRVVETLSEVVTRLLDHYTVVEGRDWEVRYAILDEPRGAVMILVEPEQQTSG